MSNIGQCLKVQWRFIKKDKLQNKPKRVFWCFVYLLKAAKFGVSAVFKEQLGSQVVHDGQRMFVCNWAGSSAPTLYQPSNGLYKEKVPRSSIENIISLREIRHRFFFMFDWYLASWFDIDIDKRLQK